jgi:hypothetical protein
MGNVPELDVSWTLSTASMMANRVGPGKSVRRVSRRRAGVPNLDPGKPGGWLPVPRTR